MLPLRSVLLTILEVVKGKGYHTYPFSQEDFRKEVYDDYLPEMIAVVLQLALHKSKLLLKDRDTLVKRGARSLIVNPDPKTSKILLAGLEG